MTQGIDSPIERVVVLMLENRSFDHMLGWMPRQGHLTGLNGLTGAEFNLRDPADPTSQRYAVGRGADFQFEGQSLPPLDPKKNADPVQGPLHEFDDTNKQLSGSTDGPGQGTPTMSGFVASFDDAQRGHAYNLAADQPGSDVLKKVMECFTPEQVPALSTLAREFMLCDRWHCSLPGPTMPNRLFMHAATSAGYNYNAFGDTYDFRTIYNSLSDAGKSWNIYFSNDNLATQFTQLKNITANFKDFGERFVADAAANALPDYSFIIPRFIDWGGHEEGVEQANSQHAPSDVRPGEQLIATVYKALRGNPDVWKNTLLVVLYDEHGGFYDHEPPPSGVPNPDGLVWPDATRAAALAAKHKTVPEPFDFTRLGVRVPAVLVSPWLPRRLDSTLYEHASVLATVKRLFGLSDYLTERDRAANTFEHLLHRDVARWRDDTPEELPVLPLPEVERPPGWETQPVDPVVAELLEGPLSKLADRQRAASFKAALAAGTLTRADAMEIDRCGLRDHFAAVAANGGLHPKRVTK